MEAVRVAQSDRFGRAAPVAPDAFLGLGRVESGLHVLAYGPARLAILVSDARSRVSFYGFHAAMSPLVRRPLPFFQGRTIAPRGVNVVLLCDPSLYLDEAVRVGWFLGNRHCALAAALPRVMDHLDARMGAERRLLWGCSAGGFAAIRYARPQDVAVAINPQTVLNHFTWGRVAPWLEHGWGLTHAAARRFCGEVGDLRARPRQGRLVYVQNTDDDHVGKHLEPYAAAHGLATAPGDDGRFRLVLGDWGAGHTPPPARWQERLLREEADRLRGGRLRGWLARLGAGLGPGR